LWLIQPDVAQRLAEDERMTEGGLLPRLLLCDVKAESVDEPEDFYEMKPVVALGWERLVLGLLEEYREQGATPRRIEATDEARTLLREFTNESKRQSNAGGPLSDVQSYAVRWGENAWRLALCLHAATHGRGGHGVELGGETARAAIGIVRWFSEAQLSFLAVSRSARAKARLERVTEILRLAGGRETVRNLKKSHHFEEDELRGLAERFPTRLVVEIVKTAGRDSLVVRLAG
ncbi:MAG: hypothetical protein JWO82_2675, partial [Akkermansiaceae bacterium]|nr:hypothetical protein [Akkermansiaceae bacterium]